MEALNEPWEVTKPFIKHIEKNKSKIEKAQSRFSNGMFGHIHSDKFRTARIHADKFDDNVFLQFDTTWFGKKKKMDVGMQ